MFTIFEKHFHIEFGIFEKLSTDKQSRSLLKTACKKPVAKSLYDMSHMICYNK